MTIITITGPTCSGKTTLEAALAQQGVGKTVSHTTRLPRAGEIDGVDYHFVTEDEYQRLSGTGKFIEEIQFGSTRYAMSAENMLRALHNHQIVAVVAEPVGTEQIVSWAVALGIPRYSLWLGVKPAVQAERFMNRLMNEAMFGIGNASAAGAARLKEMLSTEQGWIARARNGSIDGNHGYHHMMNEGTALDVQELARVVLLSAKSRLK